MTTLPYDRARREKTFLAQLEKSPRVVHELSRLFPDMSDEEFYALRVSIRTIGLREPITLYEGKVLDGRHRDLACAMEGVPPRYVDLPEGVDPIAFVIAKNVSRRNYTKGQLALLADELATLGHGGRRTRGQVADLRLEDVAQRFGVSPRLISDVRRLRNYRGTESEALLERIRQGELTPHAALKAFEEKPEIRRKEDKLEDKIGALVSLVERDNSDASLLGFQRMLRRFVTKKERRNELSANAIGSLHRALKQRSDELDAEIRALQLKQRRFDGARGYVDQRYGVQEAALNIP